MTYTDATNILDLRREGADIPPRLIDQALELTGDKKSDLLTTLIEERK